MGLEITLSSKLGKLLLRSRLSRVIIVCAFPDYKPLIVCRLDKFVDARILLIAIAFGMVLSSGTNVMAISNSTGNNTGNNTEIGSAKELEKLTGNNSLANLSTLTNFTQSGSNQSSNQSSNQTGNMSG